VRALLCTLTLAVTVSLAGAAPAVADPEATAFPAGGITCCRQ